MLTAAFVVVQVLSLAVMLLFIHEYKRITFKHERLMHSIEPHSKPVSTLHSNVIIWVYVISTIIVVVSTSSFFFVLMSV